MSSTILTSKDQLREFYPEPKGRTLKKVISTLERHSRRFIELSPFLLMSSHSAQGDGDVSPKGGNPGFVKTLDDGRVIIPDARGNNRLDGFQNVIETGKVGLIFLVPGVDETLRINGNAVLNFDPDLLALFDEERIPPKLVVDIKPNEIFFHCAKALMRSGLWSMQNQIDRSDLPTIGQMINDQIGSPAPAESQEDMVRRYQADL